MAEVYFLDSITEFTHDSLNFIFIRLEYTGTFATFTILKVNLSKKLKFLASKIDMMVNLKNSVGRCPLILAANAA